MTSSVNKIIFAVTVDASYSAGERKLQAFQSLGETVEEMSLEPREKRRRTTAVTVPKENYAPGGSSVPEVPVTIASAERL